MSLKICIYSNSEYNYVVDFMYISLNMKKFIKIWLFLLCNIVLLSMNFQFVKWDMNNPISNKNKPSNNYTVVDPEIDGNQIKDNPIWEWSNHISDKSEGILQYSYKTEDYEGRLWYVLALIQISINRLLWMLAFVSLIYMLYNWFLILSSGSDSKNADKGKKWIKNAAIAMAGIWLSWLIISAILWFINLMA